MSLEATLARTNELLEQLVVRFNTLSDATATFGQAATAADEAVKATKATRTKKDTAAPETAAPAAAAPGHVFKLAEGDAVGTRYFIIDKHNTVARVAPGDTIPSISGTVEVDGDAYLAAREAQAKKSLTAQPQAAAAQTGAPAAETAAGASTASSPAASGSPVTTFKELVDKMIVLSKDTREGRGKVAVAAILAKYQPTVEVAVRRVMALEPLNKMAEINADVDALFETGAMVEVVSDDVFA